MDIAGAEPALIGNIKHRKQLLASSMYLQLAFKKFRERHFGSKDDIYGQTLIGFFRLACIPLYLNL